MIVRNKARIINMINMRRTKTLIHCIRVSRYMDVQCCSVAQKIILVSKNLGSSPYRITSD